MVLKVLGETYFFLDPYKAGKKNQPLQTTTEQLQCREISAAQNRKELPFFDGIEWTTLFQRGDVAY